MACDLARLVDNGELEVEIDSTFALSEAASAFERSLASGKHGKVVVRVRGESIADNYVPAAAAIAY